MRKINFCYCDNCQHWSEFDCDFRKGEVIARCLNEKSEKFGKMTMGEYTCEDWMPNKDFVIENFQPHKKMFYTNKENISANEIQHGGKHYKSCKIQPWDYIAQNGLGYFEGSAIKYLTRWRNKGGVEDLKKAIHFIEKLIEFEESK